MSREAHRRLRAALDALPRRQRTLLALSRLEHLTIAQMSAVVGGGADGVRRSLVLAERAVRRELAASTGEESRRWHA
jgi:DNA-directed RNA polymerase specialized sigma24 family protein